MSLETLFAIPLAVSSEGASLASRFFVSHRVTPDGVEHIEWLGSIVIWGLLCLSALSVGLMGQLALANRRQRILPPDVCDEVEAMLKTGRYREALELTGDDDSFFSQITHGTLERSTAGFGAMVRGLEQASDEMTTIRLRKLEYLNVVGQVSPMIGLFGTVYGMILAFQSIVAGGGHADPVMLAGGIGTALTTTFWGLVVAIPALSGYAVLRNRLDERTTEATIYVETLITRFRPASAATSAKPRRVVRDKPVERATDGSGPPASQEA